MIKVTYTELDGPSGPTLRLEAAGHAGYAPAGQDIVCAGASTLMQTLVYLLAGEESAKSDAWDEPEGPRLAVTAAAPRKPWVEGAFEFAKAGFALLAERYPDHVRFADLSGRGEQSMVDLQMFAAAEATAASGGCREPMLGPRSAGHERRPRREMDAGHRNPGSGIALQMFADGGEGTSAPALSHAQAQQAIASGTMRADEGSGETPEVPAQTAPEKPGRAACTAGTSCAAPACSGPAGGRECRPCPPRPLGCRGGDDPPGRPGLLAPAGACEPRNAPSDGAARDADGGRLPSGPLQ